MHLPENVGVSGRNAGVDHVRGDLLFFLDDDAWLPDPSALAEVAEVFGTHPDIGMVQTRITDPDNPLPRAVGYLACAKATRTTFDDDVRPRGRRDGASGPVHGGGWLGHPLPYAHEGIELAWRVWDAGAIVWYAGDLTTYHPVSPATRHSVFQRMNSRNRVLLARRNLPWVLVPAYLGCGVPFSAGATVRTRIRVRKWRQGWQEGWHVDPGERRPLSWRGILEMARHGRPPIV